MTGEKYWELGIGGYLFLLCHWLPTGLWSNCFLSHVFRPCSHYFNYKVSVWFCTDGSTLQFHSTEGTFTKAGRLPLSLSLPVLCCRGVYWGFLRMNISCWNYIFLVLVKRIFWVLRLLWVQKEACGQGCSQPLCKQLGISDGSSWSLFLLKIVPCPGHSSPQPTGNSFSWLQENIAFLAYT